MKLSTWLPFLLLISLPAFAQDNLSRPAPGLHWEGMAGATRTSAWLPLAPTLTVEGITPNYLHAVGFFVSAGVAKPFATLEAYARLGYTYTQTQLTNFGNFGESFLQYRAATVQLGVRKPLYQGVDWKWVAQLGGSVAVDFTALGAGEFSREVVGAYRGTGENNRRLDVRYAYAYSGEQLPLGLYVQPALQLHRRLSRGSLFLEGGYNQGLLAVVNGSYEYLRTFDINSNLIAEDQFSFTNRQSYFHLAVGFTY